jgi:hypothetical protein
VSEVHPPVNGVVEDPPGDVVLPGADVLESSLFVSGDSYDLRVRFAATPFGATLSDSMSVCFGMQEGAACYGPYISVSAYDPSGLSVYTGAGEVPACGSAEFDMATSTLRVLVPKSFLPAGVCEYWITAAFGGSGGENERAPEDGFAGCSPVGELPPFGGTRVDCRPADGASGGR